jgi:hypothetical protein
MKAPESTTTTTDEKYADLLATQPTRYDYTAPPAKNGALHLGLGLVAALLFSGLLGSCAAPARLPLQAGVRSAEHDARTRTAEPYAVVPTKSVR